MDIKPDFENIIRAARHEEPKRVPLCENLIEYPIQSKFLGREVTNDDINSQLDFWFNAGYDYIPITIGMMSPGKVTEESSISKVIRDVIIGDSYNITDDKSWNLEFSNFIRDRSDFEIFPWEIAGKYDLKKFHEIKELLPERMKVIAISGKIFTLSWMLMGFNNFAVSLKLDEQLVADVIQKITKIQIQGLKRVLRMPYVGAIWVVDDLAFSSGPIISPQALRDHIFPCYKELAKQCHDNNKLLFFHSDGDLTVIMEDIIEIGVDVLHPIDPTCMDIIQVKENYGDRLCLAGNVSTELLHSGTPTEVEEKVRELILKVAPGGGYCIGSGNSVASWVKFENYMAMREATFRYGTYPIQMRTK